MGSDDWFIKVAKEGEIWRLFFQLTFSTFVYASFMVNGGIISRYWWWYVLWAGGERKHGGGPTKEKNIDQWINLEDT